MLDPEHITSPHHEHPFLFNSTGLTHQRSDTYAFRTQKTAQNYRSWNSMGARITNDDDGDGFDDKYASGVCSPPLWKATSPPRTTQRPINNYRSLSPASRTRAIARGQREMMEMVQNMPESCYELSLKDLVEKQPMAIGIEVEEEEDASTEILVRGQDGLKKKKKNERKPLVSRTRSMDSGGFLLKMVLPISFGSKKKMNYTKKSENCVVANSSTAKVSPKPQVFDGSHGKAGVVENEWWRKRVSGSGKSESGVSSLNSGSMKSSGSSSTSSYSSRSNSRRKSGGCWCFTLLKKNKRVN